VHGEIAFNFDDDIFDVVEADYLVLLVDGIMVPFFIEEYRFKNDSTALMKFEGVDTVERARELTGTSVFFPRSLTPTPSDDQGSITYAMLVGYQVINSNDGKKVGEIALIDDQTINIMFELTDGTLLPASEELITDIDTEGKTITLSIPDGLL
jgi:16S rRNA processing protein RimM